MKINKERALDLLARVVADKGNSFIYTKRNGGSCVYEHNGEASCMIGQALHLGGISIDLLKELDLHGEIGDGNSEAILFLEDNNVHLTKKAALAFAAAQASQDNLSTWGEALIEARCSGVAAS